MGRAARSLRVQKFAAVILVAIVAFLLLGPSLNTDQIKNIANSNVVVKLNSGIDPPAREADLDRAPASTTTNSRDTRQAGSKLVKSPFDMILGLSHHKTGTFQLRCIMKHYSAVAGIPEPTGVCFKDNNVNEQDLRACYQNRTLNNPNPPKPVLYKTFHGMKQICDEGKDHWEPCLSFMIYKPCSQRNTEWMRRSGECHFDLPSNLKIGVFNIVRNPIDSVLSAFSFHTGRPKSEPWLFRKHTVEKFYAPKLKWAGADDDILRKMGVEDGEMISYVDLLTRLPIELGVLLEFWHSLPEIASIARQYQILSSHEGAFNARFEDLRDHYNKTILNSLDMFKIGPDAKKMLEATVKGGCDPNMWTEEQRAASDHVTVGKEEGAKERAEKALMEYPPAKEILCDMCIDMGYQDSRCGQSDDAEWKKKKQL